MLDTRLPAFQTEISRAEVTVTEQVIGAFRVKGALTSHSSLEFALTVDTGQTTFAVSVVGTHGAYRLPLTYILSTYSTSAFLFHLALLTRKFLFV